jgi:hypothetical protein
MRHRILSFFVFFSFFAFLPLASAQQVVSTDTKTPDDVMQMLVDYANQHPCVSKVFTGEKNKCYSDMVAYLKHLEGLMHDAQFIAHNVWHDTHDGTITPENIAAHLAEHTDMTKRYNAFRALETKIQQEYKNATKPKPSETSTKGAGYTAPVDGTILEKSTAQCTDKKFNVIDRVCLRKALRLTDPAAIARRVNGK